MPKKKSPLVGVVVPCYNAAIYLADSISSILGQTLKEIEVIVVNDCSTDDSLDILEYYAKNDERLKIVNLPVNGGMSNARNEGNKVVTAPLIAVQDADDISYPNRLERQLAYFKEHPETDLLFTAYDIINVDNEVIAKAKAEPFDIENVFKEGTAFVGHPTFMYKRDVILKNPYENGQWSKLGCEDFRLVTHLWKTRHNLCNINEILVHYRLHKSNSSNTRDEKMVQAIKREYINTYLVGGQI